MSTLDVAKLRYVRRIPPLDFEQGSTDRPE